MGTNFRAKFTTPNLRAAVDTVCGVSKISYPVRYLRARFPLILEQMLTARKYERVSLISFIKCLNAASGGEDDLRKVEKYVNCSLSMGSE